MTDRVGIRRSTRGRTFARIASRPPAEILVLLLGMLLTGSLPAESAAQRWTAEMRAGELRYEGGPGLQSSTATVGLRYASSTTTFATSAGIPLGSDEPLWGVVAGARRVADRFGPVTVGVDLAADLFLQRDRVDRAGPGGPELGSPGGILPPQRPLPEAPLDGWGATAGAMPVIGLGDPSLGIELRAGGTAYRSEFAGETFDRELAEVDAAARWAPARRLLLGATARRAIADEDTYDRIGVSAAVDHGWGALFGSVGRWLGDGIDGMEWSAGAVVELTERVDLRLSARHTVFDPMYLAPERTSWGGGVSVTLARPSPPAPPVPASYRNGTATIVLGEEASRGDGPVRIAGDFTDWNPVAMERTGNGWRYTGPLEPGVYNYAFVTADGRWFVPEGHPGRKKDGFGGHVAVLVVEEAS